MSELRPEPYAQLRSGAAALDWIAAGRGVSRRAYGAILALALGVKGAFRMTGCSGGLRQPDSAPTGSWGERADQRLGHALGVSPPRGRPLSGRAPPDLRGKARDGWPPSNQTMT
jgi:hypothetical protein